MRTVWRWCQHEVQHVSVNMLRLPHTPAPITSTTSYLCHLSCCTRDGFNDGAVELRPAHARIHTVTQCVSTLRACHPLCMPASCMHVCAVHCALCNKHAHLKRRMCSLLWCAATVTTVAAAATDTAGLEVSTPKCRCIQQLRAGWGASRPG